jgi:ATP-utilizing enzymes of ATP-grasp superfamily (probably carboligases)
MEGLETAVITEKSRESFYRQFGFIDHVLSYQEPDQAVDLLNSAGDVIVPHGSLIEHIGLAKASKLKDKSIFGTRNLFQWESNQKRKMNLLRSAKIKVPKEFESPDDVDRRVIVKLPGAKGGKGYF